MTTRRALFGLIAAPVVIALPASAEALAAGNPDAEILDLERQRQIAAAAYDRLATRADELHAQALAAFPSKPEALRVRADDWLTVQAGKGPDGFMSELAVNDWREALERFARDQRHWDLIPRQRDRMLARGAEVLAAAEAHTVVCEEAYVATGARRASDLSEAADRVLSDLEDRILRSSARTAEGLAIKARMVSHVLGDEPDGTYEDHATRCLLADLMA